MKKGVKKMPNHVPVVLMCSVLKQATGPNRKQLRIEEAQDRKADTRILKYKGYTEAKNRRKATALRVSKQVIRATTRRIEREAAKKKGKPVVYSIA